MARTRTSAELVKLLDRVAVPVYAFDETRRLCYVNEACSRWLQVDASALLGKQGGYHAAAESAGDAATTAAHFLCPPPPAFAGLSLTYRRSWPVGVNAQEHCFRAMPLSDASDTVAVVLAVGASPASDEAETPVDVAGSQEADRLHAGLQRFFAEQHAAHRLERLVGGSPAIERARAQAALAIESGANVLLYGPAGSGRQWLARAIHQAAVGASSAGSGALIPLDCATLAEDLLASTLAAAIKAHPWREGARPPTGTLLLLDFDRLPRETLTEFAKLLAPRRTGLRIIATSQRSAAELMGVDKFPAALVLGCATLEIVLPSLAERLEDLPACVQVLVERHNARGGKQLAGASPDTLDLLAAYAWPGNLAELESVLEQAHDQAEGPLLLPADLPRAFQQGLAAQSRPKRAAETIKLPHFLAEVERELITRALAQTKGNKAKAARLLGISRPTLLRRLTRLKLE